MSDDEISLEDLNREILECARYGEAEDLKVLLSAGAEVDHKDESGNSALHKASANGEVECLKVLKEYNARYFPNYAGNWPIHWAVQNQKLDAVKYLLDNFEVDVLAKNSYGRSALTDAFQSGNTDVIEACLSHSSSTEERLLSSDVDKIKDNEESEQALAGAVTHLFNFRKVTPASGDICQEENQEVLTVRELPITRADNPFGNESAPQDDTTGLGIWPASLLMARYAVDMKEMLEGKVVVELGCGCGVPGLAAAMYCNPRRMYLTDIHEPTLDNLRYNVSANGLNLVDECEAAESASEEIAQSMGETVFRAPTTSPSAETGGEVEGGETAVVVKCVNWQDPSTYPSEPADVVIGSDLVYDDGILTMLVPALSRILKEGGTFLYCAPNTDRAGMPRLVDALASAGLHCVDCKPAPDEMFDNPLDSGDSDQYVLHFYDLSARRPHTLFHFVKASAVASTRSSG